MACFGQEENLHAGVNNVTLSWVLSDQGGQYQQDLQIPKFAVAIFVITVISVLQLAIKFNSIDMKSEPFWMWGC